MQKTARIAGERNAMSREYGVAKAYEPTWLDAVLAKGAVFCVSLFKQLCIVFASVALDQGAKAIRSKGNEKIRSVLTGSGAVDSTDNSDRREYNRSRLYGNNYESGYDKYDKYNINNVNNSFNDVPGFSKLN